MAWRSSGIGTLAVMAMVALPVPAGPGWTRGGRAQGAAPDVASDAAPSKAPAAPQTDALF